eukprot:SAG11_NODE_12952_length_677_cov_1.152249_1_plen_74_part_00
MIEALGGIDGIDAEEVCRGDFGAIAHLITVFNDLCQPDSSRSASEAVQNEWWGRGTGAPPAAAPQRLSATGAR